LDSLNQIQVIKRTRHTKNEIYKNVEQETQLVSLKLTDTAVDKVNIEKIRDIRLALRRRYSNRNNFNKIFKDWDLSNNGEISLYDAHKMINSFGIPINYNETRALISSTRINNSDTLDMDGFMTLIFSDNPALTIDHFVYKDENIIKEGEQTENFKKNLRMNVGEVAKKKDTEFLMEFLRIRIPNLAKKFHEELEKNEQNDKIFCNLETFNTVIKSFNLPLKYSNNALMEKLFDEFKNKENGMLDSKKFLDHVVNLKNQNDFFNFKEKYLQGIYHKIDSEKKELKELFIKNGHLIEAEEKLKEEKLKMS